MIYMAINNIPEEVSLILSRLGERISLARKKRKWSQTQLAELSGLSRSTIQSIERGESTCAIGSVFHVLWVIGASNELDLIANPGLDQHSVSIAVSNGRLKTFIPGAVDNDF